MSLESIALIPSGYKATKVYSQLPVNGNGDFTYDRGTADQATRVNKNGLIEDVALDVPRLDYLDGGCPSLLLEPATTNLITYSEDITNAAWTKGSGGVGVAPVVTANFALSPDGSVNADRVQLDSGGGTTSSDFSYVSRGITVSSGATVTFSVYLKSNTGSNQTIIWYEGQDAANYNQSFTITTEWQRFVFTSTVPATTSSPLIGLRPTYFGLEQDATADFLMWGGQLEQKSYATSYIPTSGSTATRNAETCNGAGTTAEINSQEGVLFGEFRAIADSQTFRSISISDGTSTQRVSFNYNTTSNQISGFIRDTTGTLLSQAVDLIDITNYHKFALKYSNGDFKFYINGLLVAVSSTARIFASNVLNELAFDNGSGLDDFYGRVKKLSVYDDTTTDLEALTGFTSFAEMASYLSYS